MRARRSFIADLSHVSAASRGLSDRSTLSEVREGERSCEIERESETDFRDSRLIYLVGISARDRLFLSRED